MPAHEVVAQGDNPGACIKDDRSPTCPYFDTGRIPAILEGGCTRRRIGSSNTAKADHKPFVHFALLHEKRKSLQVKAQASLRGI
jgi:hypothetical protein